MLVENCFQLLLYASVGREFYMVPKKGKEFKQNQRFFLMVKHPPIMHSSIFLQNVGIYITKLFFLSQNHSSSCIPGLGATRYKIYFKVLQHRGMQMCACLFNVFSRVASCPHRNSHFQGGQLASFNIRFEKPHCKVLSTASYLS